MAWGITAGMIMIALFFAFIATIIFKETRTHRFWRRQVEAGDLEMIGQLVQQQVDYWRSERPPKGTPAGGWQGVQSVELVEAGRDYVRASTTAEPQFAFVSGQRRQVSGALDAAKLIAARLAERFFYDIPHVRPERVQIDCYSTYHEPGGAATQRCILSLLARRADAADIDWENDAPGAIVDRLGARYEVDSRGEALPIEPDEQAVRMSANGSRADGLPAEAER